MYAELEKFLAAHEHSERHAKVLDCLLECRNKPPVDRSKRNSIESGNRSGKAGSEEAIVDKVRVHRHTHYHNFIMSTIKNGIQEIGIQPRTPVTQSFN